MSALGNKNVVVVTTPGFFANLVTEAEAKLTELVASGEAEAIAIYDKVEPIVVAEAENFAVALGTIALGAVLKQVPLMLSGTEKFGAAVADTVMTVETQGKTIAHSDAQAAVQQSFDALGIAKGNLTDAAVAAAGRL